MNAIKHLAVFCASRGVSEEVMAQHLKELRGLDLEALKQRAAVVAQVGGDAALHWSGTRCLMYHYSAVFDHWDGVPSEIDCN